MFLIYIYIFIAGGKFDCMYSVTEEPYTYLTVFNNDTTVDESATFRYLCYASNILFYIKSTKNGD